MRTILIALLITLATQAGADTENLEFFQCQEQKQRSYRNYSLGTEEFSNDYRIVEKEQIKEFVVKVNHKLEEIAFSSWEKVNGTGLLFHDCRRMRDEPEFYDFKWTFINVPLIYHNDRNRSLAATCITPTRPADFSIQSFFLDRKRNIFHYFETMQRNYHRETGEYIELFSRYSYIGTCEKIPFNPEAITVASYLGTAEFCAAYGIDYRDLATKIIQGTLKNTQFNAAFSKNDFLNAVEKGNFGEIFSTERGDFVSIPKESEDPFEGCKRTHLEVIKISKLK